MARDIILPLFDHNCKLCDIPQAGLVSTVCVPMTGFNSGGNRSLTLMPTKTKALLLVGEAPGATENERGVNFVGRSGRQLNGWLSCTQIEAHCDVYCTNAVKCFEREIKPKHIKACSHYLASDITKLVQHYGPANVALLCLGSVACSAVLGESTLTKAFRKQGTMVAVPGGHKLRVFVTYHPAHVMRSKASKLIDAVGDHLKLAGRWAKDPKSIGRTQAFRIYDERIPVRSVVDYLMENRIHEIGLDFESYGIDATKPIQNYFHPKKSMKWDKVSASDLLLTAAIAWQERDLKLCGAAYDLRKASHLRAFADFMEYCQDTKTKLVFKNGCFDLSYWEEFRAAILPDIKPFTMKSIVIDVDAWNYLYSDVRPERSLKNLSVLLGVGNYEEVGFQRYKPVGRKAKTYNLIDSVHTIGCTEQLRADIRDRYGSQSPKLSKFTEKWYSDLAHLCTHMSMSGVRLDVGVIRKEQAELHEAAEALLEETTKAGLIICGKGSQSSIQQLYEAANLEAVRLNAKFKPAKTKTGKYTSDAEATENLLGLLPISSEPAELLRLYKQFGRHKKLLNAYLAPLIGDDNPIGNPGKKKAPFRSHVIGDFVYPLWNPVPSELDIGFSSESMGGTKQCRVTARDPGIQTWLRRYLSEFVVPHRKGWFMLSGDLSQIELRVGAVIYNEPKMINEYSQGIDRHWLRACQIFEGRPCPKHGDVYHKDCDVPGMGISGRAQCVVARDTGKTTNFLILYFGNWFRLMQTLKSDVGLDVSEDFCKRIVRSAPKDYPSLYANEMALIREVTRLGYYQDPVIGFGRIFTQSRKSNEDYEKEIVNVPVQGSAANIMLSILMSVLNMIQQRKLKTRIIFNGFDSYKITGPKSEYQIILDQINAASQSTPYIDRFREAYEYRQIDMKLDASVVWG